MTKNWNPVPANRCDILFSDAFRFGFDMEIIVLFIFPNYFKATLGKNTHGNLFTYIYTILSAISTLKISGLSHRTVCQGRDTESMWADQCLPFGIVLCIFLLSFMQTSNIK